MDAGAASDWGELVEGAAGGLIEVGGWAAEGGDADAVLVDQAGVGEGHGDLVGEDELVGEAHVHRGGRVDDELEGEVLFLAEEFDKEPIQPREDVPVDVPQVVARDVVAEVVELDRAAAAFAAAFAGHLAGEHFSGEQVEAVEAGAELGGEEFVEGLGLWGGEAGEHGGSVGRREEGTEEAVLSGACAGCRRGRRRCTSRR